MKVTNSRIATLAAAAVIGVSFHACHTQAATLIENFNDYGETDDDLLGKGSTGGGWTGGWSATQNPDYFSGVQLTFDNANYSNALNQDGPDDGAAGYGGGDAGGPIIRSFSQKLDGTIWISALTRHASASG